MARYTCWKCGSGYDGANCGVCAINRQAEEAADQASRDQERATAAMEAAVSEQTERLAEEMARSREAAEEAAFETQMAIAEAAERQKRAMAESVAEHKRIAANAWRLQAQEKADQAYRLFQSGLLAEGLDLALQAIREDPGNIDGVFVAGACLEGQGKAEEGHPYLVKQVQMLNMPAYQREIKFHTQVLRAIGSDPALSRVCCETIRGNLSSWPPCESIEGSDRLVNRLIEREEYELAVLVQQWMLQSKGVTLAALLSTRMTFRALVGSSAGLDAARAQLDKLIQWLEGRTSLLALAFSLEFATLLGTKTDALDSYFKRLSFARRGDFEQELKNLEQTVFQGDVDRESFSRIKDSAKQKYSSWEPDLKSEISSRVLGQVKNSPKQNLGCAAGLVWFFALCAIQVVIPLARGIQPSFATPWYGLLAWGSFLGMIFLGILTANTIRSFRRHKLGRELLKAGVSRQNKAFEELGLPQISAPKLFLRSPMIDFAIFSVVTGAFLIGWCLLVLWVTRPSQTASVTPQVYNGTGIEDDLAGHSAGNAFGIQWINALGNRGAVFSAANSSRIEYPGFIPPEGTLEFWIKVDRGYQYANSVFKPNQDDAMIFSSDVQGGDVTWPGTTTVYVSRNGSLKLWMATVKGPNHVPPTEARATGFAFGQWHAIGVSYGSQGQYIMLDGKLVASAPGRTQTFGAAGTQESPLDIPTIGETVSHFWQHHRYEGGFEGVLAAFRTSDKQRDWNLARGIPAESGQRSGAESDTPNAAEQTASSVPENTSREINSAINSWRDAMLSNDPARVADCYAATIDRYFLQTNVTHDYVKQDILKLHDRGDVFKDEAISQIILQSISDSTVEAQFIESFDSLTAGQNKKGTVWTILHFTNEAGGWKISYERQLNSAPGNTTIDNATIQNTTSSSDSPTEPAEKTTDNSAIAPSLARHSDQMLAESGTSNTQSLESGATAAVRDAPDRSSSRAPHRALPPQSIIRTDADRRGTLTLFPDHIEYRDEGMGTNGGHAPYGPNPDNNFTLSCAEILAIKAYGFRPVLFGSYQVVITARSGKYHIPALHSQPIVQGIQNGCGVGTGDSIQKR